MAEEKDKQTIEDELASIKDEMKELKEMMKKQRSEGEGAHFEGPESDDPPHDRSRKEFDSHEFEGVGDTINLYLESVMQGVAQSLKQSMQQMAKGFTFNIENLEDLEDLKDIGKEFKEMGREVSKAQREIAREKRRIAKEARRMARETRKAARERDFRLSKLTGEELDRFYEIAPQLMSALADEKKLRLLKALEEGPEYQKDLSDKTDIKGGTFKHHMDSLLESKYIYQEQARGRYLINQLGIEALKLAEMLFRRYIFVTEEDAKMKEVEVEFEDDLEDMEDDLDDIEEDIDETIEDIKEEIQEYEEETEEEINEEIDDELNDLKDRVNDILDDQNDREEG